jgi:hypothetical protein
MLGEMTAERYLGEKLRSRTIYKIEEMDAAIIRGRKVRLGEEVVLELNHAPPHGDRGRQRDLSLRL